MREPLQEPGGDSVGQESWASGGWGHVKWAGGKHSNCSSVGAGRGNLPFGLLCLELLARGDVGFLWILGSIPHMFLPVSTDSLYRGGCNRRWCLCPVVKRASWSRKQTWERGILLQYHVLLDVLTL